MKRQKGSIGDVGVALALLYIVLAIAGIIGWVLNIAKLVGDFGGPLTAKLVLRIVGIFAAPLGAILGYL